MATPLVSICSITYNHAPFIRQCLDGFLMQQTNFPIEIIINDDCSTDGTTEIIREYEAKYPDKICPIYHEENQYSKGVRGMFQKFVYPKARGKYIALCEGDDYWTDPLKLQKQVDFLESHPECSMCFHKVKVWDTNKAMEADTFNHLEERYYSAADIIARWTVPTCSVMLRSDILKHVPINKKFQYGDNVLFLTSASRGKLYCLDQDMGVYNIHPGGFLSCKTQEKFALEQLTHFLGLKEEFGGNALLRCEINRIIYHYSLSLVSLYKRTSMSKMLKYLLYGMSNGAFGFLSYYIRRKWR